MLALFVYLFSQLAMQYGYLDYTITLGFKKKGLRMARKTIDSLTTFLIKKTIFGKN